MDDGLVMDWTRADVDQVLVLVVGPVAGFVALIAVFLLGMSLLKDLGR